MRKAICLMVLALAGCAENTGWNPNYSAGTGLFGNGVTDRGNVGYAAYKVAREQALVGQRPIPDVVPVALPVQSPTAAEIAGPNLWQIIQRDAQATMGGTRAVAVVPVTATSGAYPGSVPVLARYAVSVNHQPGQTVWPRSAPNPALAARMCGGYASTDAAQIAFLAKGGPQADPLGMDPDGDGFVCGWRPDAWRRAAR